MTVLDCLFAFKRQNLKLLWKKPAGIVNHPDVKGSNGLHKPASKASSVPTKQRNRLELFTCIFPSLCLRQQ